MQTKTKQSLLKLLSIAVILPLIGIGCKNAGTIAQDSLPPVTLEYWRVFDDPSDFTDIIAGFQSAHPHVRINIKKIRFDEYEDAVIRALAEGTGPDIISVHSTWMKQYKNILDPMPASATVPTAFADGRNVSIKLQTQRLPNERDLRNLFVDTVADDVVVDGDIYGLPLSVDTMVLYYNRALLNQANIATPPRTWEDFKEHVKLLTVQDRGGNIIQSGAPFGGSRNINRAPDLVALLMMQNGVTMTNQENTEVTFNAGIGRRNEVAPSVDALRFYTDFASPSKEVYTWNETMAESLDAFTNNQAAYFFGYSYHKPLIHSLSPDLDLGISQIPQISETGPYTNIANYWIEGVTKQSEHKNEAWEFIRFATSESQVRSYLEKAQTPTALRSLISEQRNNDDLAPFANQLLTSVNWYHGANAAAMEEAMRIMISEVLTGARTPDEAIVNAVESINASY